MNKIDTLTSKVKLAVEKINQLKAEKEKLSAELRFQQEENERNRSGFVQSVSWKEEKRNLILKVEKVLKKIDALKL